MSLQKNITFIQYYINRYIEYSLEINKRTKPNLYTKQFKQNFKYKKRKTNLGRTNKQRVVIQLQNNAHPSPQIKLMGGGNFSSFTDFLGFCRLHLAQKIYS